MLLLRLFIEKRIDEPVHLSALFAHQRTGRAAFLGPEVVIRKQTQIALNQGQRRAQLMAEQPQSANSGGKIPTHGSRSPPSVGPARLPVKP